MIPPGAVPTRRPGKAAATVGSVPVADRATIPSAAANSSADRPPPRSARPSTARISSTWTTWMMSWTAATKQSPIRMRDRSSARLRTWNPAQMNSPRPRWRISKANPRSSRPNLSHPGAGFDADEPGGNRPRRRRRGRRGRGGRNRGNDRGPLNQPPPLQDQPDGSQLPLDEPEPLPHEPAQPDSDQKPKPTGHRRRGRRGGRGRRGRGPASETRQPPAQPSTSSSHHESPRASEAPTLTKTGSADRHLVNDEPIAPQPVFRPGNVRDLDSIPDDYD